MPKGLAHAMSDEETKQLLRSIRDYVDSIGRWLSIVVVMLIAAIVLCIIAVEQIEVM